MSKQVANTTSGLTREALLAMLVLRTSSFLLTIRYLKDLIEVVP
jgi:hypothetical protein